MIRRPPRSTPLYSAAASDVYKRQHLLLPASRPLARHVSDDLLGTELGRPDDVDEHDVISPRRGRSDGLVMQSLIRHEVQSYLDVRVGCLEGASHLADVLLGVARLLHDQCPDS